MESWRSYKIRSNPLEMEPGLFLRWGTTMLFIIFLLIVLLAGFVPFNQVVKGTVTVTSKNPPAEIKVKRTGKISALHFHQGDSLAAGDIIAVLESMAEPKDVAYLKEKLKESLPALLSLESLITEYPSDLKLGASIQPNYHKFLEEYQKIILESAFNENEVLEVQLQDDIRNKVSILKSKEEELVLMENVLSVSMKNLDRHRKLHLKGVISRADLEKIELEHTEKERQYSLIKQQVILLNAEKNRTRSNLEILHNTGYNKISQNKAEISFAQQNLLNSIREWEEEYSIKSPIEGKLSYNDVWNQYQNVEEGEVVFTVVPYNRCEYLGRCIIPAKNAGQIKKGQKVFLKLENYPYRQWGTIEARVNSISQVPTREIIPAYVIYLDVDNLTTSYGKDLIFNQELIGAAEILLQEVTLFERVFYQFRYLWAS